MQSERSKVLGCNSKALTTISKFYTYTNNLLIIYPRRRLGIWRRVFDESGGSRKCFVSVSGDSVLEPECFGVAKRELSILEENGVSQRGYNSSLSGVMDLKPFSDFKGGNMRSLSYWYIPNSVKHQYYVNYNLSNLADWQVDALSRILSSVVVDKEGLRDRQDKISRDHSSQMSALSPCMIISPNVSENLTICEVVALNGLLYSGGNVLAIFPNPQKCNSYYQRCKSLFGGGSVNLRIELFGQSSRDISSSWFPNIDLTICTMEKANTLINRLIFDNMLSECIQTIIIDDINLVGDSEKGHLLENILTKITYVNLAHDCYAGKNLYKNSRNGKITCLYVSNSRFSNLETFKDVLKVRQVFENGKDESEFEPEVYIKRNNHLFFWDKENSDKTVNDVRNFEISEIFENDKYSSSTQQTAANDLKYFTDLILESLVKDRKTLVFCPTIEWCRKSLHAISTEISESLLGRGKHTSYTQELQKSSRLAQFANQMTQNRPSRVQIIENLKKVSRNGSQVENDSLLAEGILNFGIAIHNLKLLFKERKIIEDAFKGNHLKVLFCTSFHMMDSEIKADRIIIRSIGLGKINSLTKNKTGNREWISKSTLKQFFSRIDHSSLEKPAQTQKHATKNACITNWVGSEFRGGIFIFTSNDLEFRHLDSLLNDVDFRILEFVSHLTQLNLFRLILELIQTDLVRDVGSLDLLIHRLTFRGRLDGSEYRSVFDVLTGDYQKLLQVTQGGISLSEDMLLSLSFLVVNQLIFFDSSREEYNMNEIYLSKTYVSQLQDQFGHLKSPIVSSKYALIGSKTRDKLNKSVLGIILRQNDLLTKFGSGRKYCLSFFSNVGSCIGNCRIFGTSLATALVQSQLHPCIVLEIHSELFRSKLIGVDLSSNLHVFILGLLAYNGSQLKVNWNNYLQIFSDLTPKEMEIADLYGVDFKVISDIARAMTSNSSLIPDISRLSPISIHLSYFYSETINFKGLVEKYRLISIYRFYYACFLRDLCNPMLTFDLIMVKYLVDPNTIRLIINSFHLSINTVSTICRLVGWVELGEIVLGIKNLLESSISIRNVKYLYKITQEQQNPSKGLLRTSSTSKCTSGSQPQLEDHSIDQQDISRIMNYVNLFLTLSHHITPNIAISLYFSGLTSIESIATASTENIMKSLQNAGKLDDYFGQFTNKSSAPSLNLMVTCQEIIQQAKMALSQSESHQDLDSLSNLDIYTDQNDIDPDLDTFDLELVQGLA